MRESMSARMLVQHAAGGDERAWTDIVRSYTPLLDSVCRHYGMSRVDTDDIVGRVWLHLLTSISRIREPAALPGWLRTTARRECQATIRRRRDHAPLNGGETAESVAPSDADLLAAERRAVLEEALAGLSVADRTLLALLFSDPPTPYTEISTTLAMPVGAIGPTRQRILKRLRQAQVWHAYQPSW